MNAARSGRPTALAHAGVTVSDLERSIDFYVRGLGLVCTGRRRVQDEYIRRIVQVPGTDAIDIAMLAFPSGEPAIELLQYAGCERRAVRARPCDPGSGHICLVVDDIDAAWASALAAGGTPRSPGPVAIETGPNTGGHSCYLADPDGHAVELLQAPAP